MNSTNPPDPFDDARFFINRELSWLKLNERILEEASDSTQPLLERLKFLAICGSNLDEFFMVRVSGLQRQRVKGALKLPPDGMTPAEQLAAIRKEVNHILRRYTKCWHEIVPELKQKGIHIKKVSELTKNQQKNVRAYFKSTIFPTLTPLAMDISHPFPFISNLSLNLAIVMRNDEGGEKYARVKVASDIFPRLVEVSENGDAIKAAKRDDRGKKLTLVFLEDIIASNIDMLFPGVEVIATYPFRITRDAEVDISLDQASDLLTAVEESLETRRIGFPIRLEIDKSMPERVRNLFMSNLRLASDLAYKFDGPLDLANLWELHDIDRPALKYEPFLPCTATGFSDDESAFAEIAKQDQIFYYPYDSFNSLLHFLQQAATDPDVLAIRMTLYRIDKKSPVIDTLMRARENGKTVVVLVELKAKFDEGNNIVWARALEEAGVHVIYGLHDLKVHTKLCLVVRKEGDDIKYYSHISSGNFNAITSQTYGDISYYTAKRELGAEVNEVFNSLTGYSQHSEYRNLLVAPKTLRSGILARIEREIEWQKKTGEGYIAFKLNGLVDEEIIKALYRASGAGVVIDINVRGLCCLRPGIPGVSETITCTSIIGRFLEHARIYYFKNGGDEDVFIGSADMMDRNLNRRVETLLCITDPVIKKSIIETMLTVHLNDTVKARVLDANGTYRLRKPSKKEQALNSQEWLIKNRGIWHNVS